MAYLISCFLFQFSFVLLSIFMVMINIIKIELISPTENCRLTIFFVRIFFPNWIIPYLSHSYVIKIKGIDIIWRSILITYWVMSGNWKLFIDKTFQLEKNCQFIVLAKTFPFSFSTIYQSPILTLLYLPYTNDGKWRRVKWETDI